MSHCIGYRPYVQRLHALRQREGGRCGVNERERARERSSDCEIIRHNSKHIEKDSALQEEMRSF